MLPSGGRDITLALASGLGIDDDVAERLKRGEPVAAAEGPLPGAPDDGEAPAMELPPPADAPTIDALPVEAPTVNAASLPDLAEVRELALTRAGSFVDEVRSSLEFYTAQMPNAQIGRVLVVGGGSRLDGLLELLQERLPVPVDRGRLFERAKSEIDLSAEAAAEAEAVLSVAVGLAIPARRHG